MDPGGNDDTGGANDVTGVGDFDVDDDDSENSFAGLISRRQLDESRRSGGGGQISALPRYSCF